MSTKTAIIVEDQEDLAEFFQASLHDAGFLSISICRRGDDALEKIRESAPALVLLDIHLPGMSGIEVLREIKKDERLAATYVVILSADDRQASTVEDIADLVLLKPVSYLQLKTLTERLISPHE